MRAWRWALAAVLAGAACEGPTEPRPGVLDVVLTTPNTGDGAMLFAIEGPLDSVEAAGFSTFSSRLSASLERVIVTGTLTSGVVARIHVPDVNARGGYRTTVQQVADGSTFALRDTTGYRLALRPAS
jgi:hypothetical protein